MARILAIWGPSKTVRTMYKMSWRFDGVHADKEGKPSEYASWKLTFFFDSRQFRTTRLREAKTIPQEDLFRIPSLRDEKVMTGRVTTMLRARLSDEHVAEAVAAAIRFQGKRGR
jgi:hypothetical protein